MSTLSPDLTAVSILDLFSIATTKIAKPGVNQISVLCEKETTDSPSPVELSLKRLELYDDRSITPVHVHAGREKSYLRFPGSDDTDVIVFMYRNGEWRAFPIVDNGNLVVVPRGTPHAIFSTGRAMLIVISSTQDPQTEWEADSP